ncbi:ATP-grasp fold amidoligase family protein [Vreelandella alkaliphila]|uniref:ATP-grasp fold amidoligase family protein n=1 Tax=Vreelandella alkaliphila TaxID=272774 RepID=UPI003FD854F9
MIEKKLIDELAFLEKEYVSRTSGILIKSLREAKKGNVSYESVLRMARPENCTSSIFSYAKKRKVIIDGVASFKRSVSHRHYSRQIKPWSREWKLNDKFVGYCFSNSMGIQTPSIFGRGTLENCLKTCKAEGVVIKPFGGAGSNFVYLVFDQNKVFSVKNGVWLKFEDVLEELKAGINKKRIIDDWIVEEMIFEDIQVPARDLKFYCFYGKCALVLEIKRSPDLLHCFWLPDGSIADTGKYKDSSFIGEGFLKEQIKQAEMISKNIPSPYMRIDFLKSSKSPDGMVFGEFTPSPGTYEEFNVQYDTYLGHFFAEAEASLFDDLYNGKKFDALNNLPSKSNAIGFLTRDT